MGERAIPARCRWLSVRAGAILFGIGFVGLLLIMQWTAYESRKHVKVASDMLFPAALRTQEASSLFQRLTRQYNDGFVLQDRSAFERADRAAVAIFAALQGAKESLQLMPGRQKEAGEIEARLSELIKTSRPVYLKALEARAGLPKSTEAEIAALAQQNRALQSSLQKLQDDVASDFRTELSQVASWSERERTFGLVALVIMIGALVFTGMALVEVTAEKRADAVLREAHKNTEMLLDSVPSLLIGLDSGGQIIKWNRAAAVILGFDELQAIGKTLGNCGVAWLTPGLDEKVAACLRQPSEGNLENIRFERPDSTRVLGLKTIQVRDDEGIVTGGLIVGADITDRIMLEEQLRQAHKLEAIGQLAAGVAHEINTPTQFVGDNTRFLKDSWDTIAAHMKQCPLSACSPGEKCSPGACADAELAYLLEEVPKAIDQSLEGVQRIGKIVRAMKEFSHPGSDERKSVDLNRAIETTTTVARNEFKYVADIDLQFDPELPPVPCLAGEINQVFLNLILNAAQAIAERREREPEYRGTITISTQHDGKSVEVHIRDTGMGIPEKIRRRIFEPFFTTKEVGKGTGQGLALAHAVVVKKHGGQIWFESEVGAGTTFFIRLPLSLEQPANPAVSRYSALTVS